MRHFFSVWLFLVISLVTFSAPLVATAAIPQQITYQGYLTATSGAPVNKSVTLQLSLYDVAAGGTPLWTEQQVVSIADGQFSVNLGATTALKLPFDKPYYLGIKVDIDQEMSPRQQFTSSPYAIRSSTTDGVVDGAVGTGAIVDGAVTGAKLGITCTTGQVLMRSASGWGCGTVSSSDGTGTITGIIAGNGIIIGGTTATPQIDVNFGGNGSATSAARSDHDHDAIYQKKYGKVAIVAKSGGDYATPSTALSDVATWCGTPSETNPCQVKIMPGVYDQGATSLVMLDFVDVEGSGETNTVITGGIDSATSGVVNGANATLTKLTVTNSGGVDAQNAIAVFNSAATFRMIQTVARAAGAVNSYAVYNSGSGSIRIFSSYLNAPSFTIYNGSTATAATFATMFNSGTVSNAGMLTCNTSSDGKNIFYANTCPPFQKLSVIGSQPNSSAGSPYPGSTSQSNTLVKVQFNNDINSATMTNTTFTVTDQMTGAYLNGTVQYDAGTRTATFTPSVALSGQLLATVTTGVRDMSGGKLATPYSWSFSTYGGSADLKPPAVFYVTPLDKSTGVLPATSISANFDKQIDRLTNITGLLTLVDTVGAAIPGKVWVSGQNVGFTPDAPLSLGVTYTATVSGVKDLAGNAQSAPYSWNFTTAPIIAPSGVGASASTTDATVTWQAVSGATGYNLYWSTTPFGSNGGGSPSSTVTPVTPTKVTGVTSPYAFAPPASLPFTGTLNIYTSGASSNPISGVQFTLTVPSGVTVTNVISPYGGPVNPVNFNQSANQVTISYTNMYGSIGDSSTPLLTVLCSGDFTGKTLTDFSFSNVQIFDWNGSPVSGMNLTTSSNGTAGATYYFAVTAANAGGESPKSNMVSATIDPLPPVVTGANPTGTNINLPIQIGASFSEPIDMKSITAATYAVTANGSPVAGTLGQGSYCGNTGCFSGIMFQPITPLQQGTNYSITITGIKDLAGNALAAPYIWSFTTAISAPAGLIATKGNLQSTLTWQAVSGAASYNIYWSTMYGVTPQNGTKISVTGTSYNHTGLTNGTTYYYVITAVNGTTEGLPSNQAQVLIDNVPPTVTSTTPANSATGVSISSSICVNFSKSIKSSTWNNVNVSFTDAVGAVVNGSYSPYAMGCNGSGFTPSPALGFNTNYSMTVGTGVQDNAGNGLATLYSFNFTTAAVGTPSGLTAAKGNLQSTLTWTAAAAATGYNIYWSTTYGVTPQNGTKISGVTGTSYTHTGLTNGTTYYYVVAAVNGTVEGLPSYEASVLIDNVPPTVTSTTPAKDATGASISSPICVNFSKSINSDTWNNVNVSFKDAVGAVVNGSYSPYVMGCYGGGGFTPSPALGFNTTYTMSVGTGVQDNAGNGLASPYSFSFSTALATPMGLTATAGTLQAALSWTPVSGATSYNIYWSNAVGITKTNSSKISTGSAATTYSHTNLANGSTYVYRVTAVVGSSESDLSNEVKVSFDTTPPVVSYKSDGNAGNSGLSVTFSEPIDSSSFTSNTIQVTSNGAVVSGNTNFMGGANLYWNGSTTFNYGTTYTATVSGVKDTADNLMAPYSWTFTTAALGVPNVKATAGSAGSNQITLSWVMGPVSGATTYNVYWSTTTGVTTANGTKIVGAMLPFTHTGLATGTTYNYIVTAVSGSTESAASAQVSAVAP